MHPLQWLSRRDSDLAALRRAGRAAIVMPAMFALGDKVIAEPVLATFAAFGSFALLLFVDFSGPLWERLQAQAALALAGALLVSLGTLASREVWLAVPAMALVGFAVLFLGVVSSVLAGAATSLLLAFILPVTIPAALSGLPERLAGWGLAAGAALVASAVLRPTPTRTALRTAATETCRALAARLRAEVALLLAEEAGPAPAGAAAGDDLAQARDQAVARAEAALGSMDRVFLATPYRPASLSTAGRTTLRVVEELGWVGAIVAQAARRPVGAPVDRGACTVKLAAAEALECSAVLLAGRGGDCGALHVTLSALHAAQVELRRGVRGALLRVSPAAGGERDGDAHRSDGLLSALNPSFRAQELGFAVANIAHDVDLMAAAERRSWFERLLGRQPRGMASAFDAAQRRAAAHVDRGSVWLHNSLRGAAGLALAVLVANETGVQHSFWVVLGALSVLRSKALNTGQSALRAMLGTVVGFALGGLLLWAIGTDTTLLWCLLPPVVLLAGVAPAAISFAAGQAGFTLTLVFLFNIIRPSGWQVGLLRVEDIALGCAVSLVVGVLLWPRGAGAALRRALADAYAEGARYLAASVEFGLREPVEPLGEAARATAAAQRLDDAFRGYLAESGSKPMPLADVTTLLSGVSGLRIAADAVLALWEPDGGSGLEGRAEFDGGLKLYGGSAADDRTAARGELLRASALVHEWYERLATSLLSRRPPPTPLARDAGADGRLVGALGVAVREADETTEVAARLIWTGDHLDAARRLQRVVVEPARAVLGQQA